MRILGWLTVPEVTAAFLSMVRLVHIVLDYRVRCKKIELRREELGLVSGGQPFKVARARHACRRARR